MSLLKTSAYLLSSEPGKLARSGWTWIFYVFPQVLLNTCVWRRASDFSFLVCGFLHSLALPSTQESFQGPFKLYFCLKWFG